MTTAVRIVVGTFFLGMGVYALAAPASLVRPFRIHIDSAEGRSEVRAVYGGFGIAIAVLLFAVSARDDDVRTGVVVAVGAALAGMALGRVISRLADRPTAFYPIWFYFLVESVGAGVLFAVA
jgi:uncharacterized protein DUF4345